MINPHTGEILAMANRPTYDPNHPQTASLDARRNRAICDMFEPGSVFKIVTASRGAGGKEVYRDRPLLLREWLLPGG